jgi:hypothetical protein
VSYLRFSPAEYRAIARLCGPLDLRQPRLAAFQRFLADSLADTFPSLAARLAGFRRHQVKILYDHLRKSADPAADVPPHFSAEELQTLAAACRPLWGHARFAGLFHRTLVRSLQDSSPGLARKLDLLTRSQFQALCERVQGQHRGSA